MVPESEKLKGKKMRVTICYMGWKEETNSDWVSRESLSEKIPVEPRGRVFIRATVH